MANRKPPSTLDILLVVPRLECEDVGHAILHQGIDITGTIVATRGNVANDIFQPRSGRAEPFGQETQFAKRPVRINEVEVAVENSNAAR